MVGRKRKAAAVAKEETPETLVIASSSRRKSQRVSSSATKSRYFEPDSDSEEEVQTASKKAKKSNSAGRKAKKAKRVEDSDEEDNYQDEPVDDVDEDDEDQDEDDDVVVKKAAKSNGRTKNEDSEEEFDEDAPPKVTFIPIPKLRDTDGIEYTDEKLHQNTLAFLKDLKANNKRPWLKSHDGEYRRSLKDWESFVTTLTDKIISVDETIPELPFKDINFRIYRDIRFSNDPTPYKPHYAAAWSRTGRKGPYACYYVHLEPGGKSFIGGGLWHPDGEAVQRLRASIDERPRRWRRVLTEPAFQRTFFPEVGGESGTPKGKGRGKKGGGKVMAESKDHEAAVLEAFAKGNAENALKTKPKGYIAEHRDIALLKLRNFTVGKKIPDSLFTKDGGQEELLDVVRAMVGFVSHLNRVVRPDPGDDDDESEEEQ